MCILKKKKINRKESTFAHLLSEFKSKCVWTDYSLTNCYTDAVIKFIGQRISLIRKYYMELCIIFKKNFNIYFDSKSMDLEIDKLENEIVFMMGDIKSGLYSLYVTSESEYVVRNIGIKINSLVSQIVNYFVKQTGRHSVEKQSNKVFIVHGKDLTLRNTLSSYLEKQGFEPVILEKKENNGLSIIDKFVREAQSCSKAIILCTADDKIVNDSDNYFQARPNVFLELGYFICEIGSNNIILINEINSKIPTDYQGICYIMYNKEEKLKKVLEKVIIELNKS